MFDNSTPTVKGMDLLSLFDYGKRLQDTWFEEYRTSGKMPKMKIGKSFKPRKVREKKGQPFTVIGPGDTVKYMQPKSSRKKVISQRTIHLWPRKKILILQILKKCFRTIITKKENKT
jgi:hypothetical protein